MLVVCLCLFSMVMFFFFKQKTAYEMRISDWSSDVCSSDLCGRPFRIHERMFGLQVEACAEAASGARQHHRAHGTVINQRVQDRVEVQIGRASCRERVCQYV